MCNEKKTKMNVTYRGKMKPAPIRSDVILDHDEYQAYLSLRERNDALQQRVKDLEELAAHFVYGNWLRVHIGHAMMQLKINVEDETLKRFRAILANMPQNEDLTGSGAFSDTSALDSTSHAQED